MRIYFTRAIRRSFLAMLVCACAILAGDHKALNGTWTLVPAKTDFAGQPVVQTGTVTINEREGNITVSRNFVYTGATQTFYYNDTADSRNNATIRSGMDVKSKARWDHDVLKVTTSKSGAVTLETYSLAPDGTMSVNIDKPDHTPVTLVFHRK